MYENISNQHPEKEAKRLQDWETKVDTMGEFPMQAKFAAANKTDKYGRFTGYLREYVTDMFSGSGYRVPKIEGVCAQNLLVVTFAGNKFPKDWWDTAINVANGKKVEKPLTSVDDFKENTFGDMDKRVQKENIYAAIMPMYRALKESFDKRWFFERLFNRNQYIAERDSLKALTGLMMSLTGDSKKDIDKVLAEYKEAMHDSGRTSEERREEANRIKEAAKENGPQIIPDNSIREVEEKVIDNEQVKEKVEVDAETDTKDVEIELAIQEGKDLDKSISSIYR